MPNTVLVRSACAALVTAAVALSGCSRDKSFTGGCLSGSPGCTVAPPCDQLAYQCSAPGQLQVFVIDDSNLGQVPKGGNALGAKGDILLSNGTATAVIAGLGNQNYIDPSGGSLLDLSTGGTGIASNDGLNGVSTVVGILPGDAFYYTSMKIIDEPGVRVAVQFDGYLAGRLKQQDVPVHTIYEMRPCDPGIRVRSEVQNGTPDTQAWALSDGFYWSGREPVPFTAEPDAGFVHPSFGLTTINSAYRQFPWMAASMHAEPYSSYAITACNQNHLEGFNSEQISAAGLDRQVVNPREFLVYERFLAVAGSHGDVAPALDEIYDARKQLFSEQYVTISGKVDRPGALGIGTEKTSIMLWDDATASTPWTQVVPDATGAFSARVPAGKTYHLEVDSYGEKVVDQAVDPKGADLDVGTISLPSVAKVSVQVMNALGGQPVNAEIFVVPSDDATAKAVRGSFHGALGYCAPWLGPPSGGSPACNRVLTSDLAPVQFEIPAGNYHLYAFKGPFWTLDHQDVTLTPNTQSFTFSLKQLPLEPAGAVGADFHVHGHASFDSSIPDEDRVRAFSASDLEVMVATDHEVVHDYSDMLQQLGLENQMTAITGTETTGHIPFMTIPGYGFPLVIGHYNFWPLTHDPTVPREGAPFDEFQEPGQLFDQINDRHLWSSNVDPDATVRELNHPWANAEFGRDLGFPRAIFLNLLKDLPPDDDGTNQGVYVRARGTLHNNDHDAQEVMNGSANNQWLQYRAVWFYGLNQGQLKTGTANSDSHSLTDSTVGVPRNVVLASGTRGGTRGGQPFDINAFNHAVRAGHILGTNGPVIEATLDGQSGPQPFGLAPFKPAAGAKLHVKVTAAPWIPVDEIRFVVNGQVVDGATIKGSALTHPSDPFDTTNAALLRYQGDVDVASLLTGVSGDAWIVVEAGHPIPLVGDLGGGLNNTLDGVPDTSDNNGDGVVDKNDVTPGANTGPLEDPPLPATDAEPGYAFGQITRGAPCAFTNPFVLDMNGNGKFEAPGVKGGR